MDGEVCRGYKGVVGKLKGGGVKVRLMKPLEGIGSGGGGGGGVGEGITREGEARESTLGRRSWDLLTGEVFEGRVVFVVVLFNIFF